MRHRGAARARGGTGRRGPRRVRRVTRSDLVNVAGTGDVATSRPTYQNSSANLCVTSVRLCVPWLCALCFLVGGCGGSSPPAPAGKPNVLLITIDTLRADRVGRGLTPAIDALAARGVRFPNARATAPLTLPSHASILTGSLPPEHGVRVNGRRMPGRATLASAFKEAGYRTGAFVGAYVLDARFGLSLGFDTYDDRVVRDGSVR